MLNPSHLLTVAAVVRTGSFVTAANELGYTASAVSQQVAALERATGVVLFERSARSIRPTAAAELLAARGAAAVAALTRLQADVADLARAEVRRLTVGVFPSAAELVGGWLREDGAWRAGGAEVRVEVAEPSRLIAMMAGEGAVDAAVVYRFGASACSWPSGVVAEHLAEEELQVVLPASHPLASGPPPAARDLDGLPWITHTPGTSGALSVRRAWERAGISPVAVAHCDDYPAVLALVRAGLGAALVPAGALDSCGRADGLARLRVAGLEAHRSLFVLVRERTAGSAAAALVRGLRERVARGWGREASAPPVRVGRAAAPGPPPPCPVPSGGKKHGSRR